MNWEDGSLGKAVAQAINPSPLSPDLAPTVEHPYPSVFGCCSKLLSLFRYHIHSLPTRKK